MATKACYTHRKITFFQVDNTFLKSLIWKKDDQKCSKKNCCCTSLLKVQMQVQTTGYYNWDMCKFYKLCGQFKLIEPCESGVLESWGLYHSWYVIIYLLRIKVFHFLMKSLTCLLCFITFILCLGNPLLCFSWFDYLLRDFFLLRSRRSL